MTISATSYSPDSYSGNDSTTTFPITFDYKAETDILVYLVVDATRIATLKTNPTHYDIDSDDNVEMVTPPATGETLVICRKTAQTQTVNLTRGSSYLPEVLETAYDKLCLSVQELWEALGRAVKFGVTSDNSDIDFPEPEASTILAWNSDADGLENLSIGISDDYIVQMDDADAADNDYCKLTANGIEGRSYSEVLGDLSGQAAANFGMNSKKITSLATPTSDYDAATKKYVDDSIPSGIGYGSMTTTKEGGVQVGGADIITLDFDGDHFNLSESPNTEINITINTGISDNCIVQIDSASVADDEYARFTANGLESRSVAEVKADLSLDNVENTAISTYKLDDLATPDDNTDLNVSTSAHGLAPKLDNDSTHFLNGQGSWTKAGIIKDSTFPGTPSDGDSFYHTTYKTLYQYESGQTKWFPIISYSTTTLYVNKTSGSDAIGYGYASGSSAVATIAYAIDLIPPNYGGNVTVNITAEDYDETLTIGGKKPIGDYTITFQGTLSQQATATADSSVQGTGATQGSITDSGAFSETATTTVDDDSAAAQSVLNVTSTTNFTVGSNIIINPGGARQEVQTIESIQAGVSLTCVGELEYEHTAVQGDEVTQGAYSNLLIHQDTDNEYRLIDWNTEDTCTIVGTFTSAPGTPVWTIYDWGTIVNGIEVEDCQSSILFYDIKTDSVAVDRKSLYKVEFHRVKLAGASDVFWSDPYSTSLFYYSLFEHGGGNAAVRTHGGYIRLTSCKIRALSYNYGCYAAQSGYIAMSNGTIIEDADTAGFYLTNSSFGSGSLYNRIRNCAKGFYIINLSGFSGSSTNVYSGNTTDEDADAATFSIIN